MITSLRSRPVPVLDTRAEHWDTKAACRHEPDVWFDNPGLARHICHAHCPVLSQCQRGVRAARPVGAVMAGVLWTDSGTWPQPAQHQPSPKARGCSWCEVSA